MKNRKPYNLKTFIQWYNIFQIIANAYLVQQNISAGWFSEISIFCEMPDYSYKPGPLKVRYIFHRPSLLPSNTRCNYIHIYIYKFSHCPDSSYDVVNDNIEIDRSHGNNDIRVEKEAGTNIIFTRVPSRVHGPFNVVHDEILRCHHDLVRYFDKLYRTRDHVHVLLSEHAWAEYAKKIVFV